jgi:GTP-binding protein HflX
MIETSKPSERAILVGIIYPGQDEREVDDFLGELSFLTETAGAEPLKRFIQKLDMPNPRTFVGSGKIEEIASFVQENSVDIAIFDDELSPSQLRNIEKALGCRILDRTNLILDIFAHRARTSHARTQVELAQYQYLLPRLTGLWTHLERQRGLRHNLKKSTHRWPHSEKAVEKWYVWRLSDIPMSGNPQL